MNKSHYNKKHKKLARNLRKDGTEGEAILWDEVLRAKQFYGYQFNRQFCIDDYIVDFISRKLKLIVEVDGYSHNFKYEEDKLRDEKLKKLGYTIVRFLEKEVRDDLDNVIRVLEAICLKNDWDQSSCPPSPRRNSLINFEARIKVPLGEEGFREIDKSPYRDLAQIHIANI